MMPLFGTSSRPSVDWRRFVIQVYFHGALVYGALISDLSEIEGKGRPETSPSAPAWRSPCSWPPLLQGPLAKRVARSCCPELLRAPRREILQSRRRKDTAALDRVEVQIRDTRAPSKLRGALQKPSTSAVCV